ncbi:regulatory protein RecX [Deminuibacter soli]|nr:regulatory protein RecX [Deminuibacter soli]
MYTKGNISKEKAIPKIRHYCAYQERSHEEVKTKLYGMGLYKSDVETILAQLIEEDYLNESRYAEQFAGGHFRTKKWGRKKIRYELSLKRVSTYNINRAIKSIDEDAYQAMVLQLVTARWQQLEKETPLVRKMKTTSYLLQKGFEPELIQAAIQQMPV